MDDTIAGTGEVESARILAAAGTGTWWGKTAVEVIEALKNGEVTPLELLDVAEARIRATDDVLNATPILCVDRAREHARRISTPSSLSPSFLPSSSSTSSSLKFPRGYLHGLPLLVKDVTAVAGVPFTKGSSVIAAAAAVAPPPSPPFVRLLEEKGGVIMGKTNTPELGAGAQTFNSVFGTTNNPWDVRLTPGGSSGGTAAALAGGQAWLATGSDLGGSLRIPASFCGVVGLRPTPGRVAGAAHPWLQQQQQERKERKEGGREKLMVVEKRKKKREEEEEEEGKDEEEEEEEEEGMLDPRHAFLAGVEGPMARNASLLCTTAGATEPPGPSAEAGIAAAAAAGLAGTAAGRMAPQDERATSILRRHSVSTTAAEAGVVQVTVRRREGGRGRGDGRGRGLLRPSAAAAAAAATAVAPSSSFSSSSDAPRSRPPCYPPPLPHPTPVAAAAAADPSPPPPSPPPSPISLSKTRKERFETFHVKSFEEVMAERQGGGDGGGGREGGGGRGEEEEEGGEHGGRRTGDGEEEEEASKKRPLAIGKEAAAAAGAGAGTATAAAVSGGAASGRGGGAAGGEGGAAAAAQGEIGVGSPQIPQEPLIPNTTNNKRQCLAPTPAALPPSLPLPSGGPEANFPLSVPVEPSRAEVVAERGVKGGKEEEDGQQGMEGVGEAGGKGFGGEEWGKEGNEEEYYEEGEEAGEEREGQGQEEELDEDEAALMALLEND
ncbi:hypothetical protein VYU27_003421 [Nannochloropsis oceanica]